MTFAYQLKSEICSNTSFTAHHKKAQGYGLFLFSKYFSADSIALHTEHEQVAQLYSKLMFQLTGLRPVIRQKENIRADGALFLASLDSQEDRLALLEYFGYQKGDFISVRREHFAEQDGVNAFVSGAFLACGNASDPRKDYHLEFSLRNELLANQLQDLLVELGIEAGISLRKNQFVVYIKDSTSLEDVITLMGATRTTLSLMDMKIYKELRNNLNRVTNCETANIEKTAAAAVQQIREIEYIMDSGAFEALPAQLRQLALLRVENPEMSLRELGEALEPPLSRSGVNHRLQRLCKIAAQLRNSEEL